MRNYSAMGLIFASMHDAALRECTAVRALGSLPFGGRYRLIDFVLSGMVNAGITKVGVITKSKYQSLMDHLGSGKAWDLSRKNEGLFFLPPTSSDDAMYQGRISSLSDVMPFLNHSKEEYVILSDCHMVTSMDYGAMLKNHIDSGADVTVACCRGKVPPLEDVPRFTVDPQGAVTDVLIGAADDGEADYGIGTYIVKKDWLIRTLREAVARNQLNFERDVIQGGLGNPTIHAFSVHNLVMPIYSLDSYFRANLALLDKDVRAGLFPQKRPVYTKLRDCAPAHYGLHAQVENSLVADGAFIDGTVRNSIVFRGVHVARDAVVENCVLMQDVIVSRNCRLQSIIADKNVVFREGRVLQGFDTYPVYVSKNTVV